MSFQHPSALVYGYQRSAFEQAWDEWVPYSQLHQHKLAAMYSITMFPILSLRFHGLSESLCVDAVITAIRRSFDFGKLSVPQMAEYWAEGVEPRLWEAITVFVPADKVAAAIRRGRRLREDREDEEYERKCEKFY